MTVFWILTALAAALAGLLVTAFARRGATATAGLSADVEAAELTELDRLRDRGLLDAEAHASARAEAGRRMLAGPAEVQVAPSSDAMDARVVLAATAAAVFGALGLYWGLGDPGLPDQSYAERVEAWSSSTETLEPVQVAAVLAREAELRPDEPGVQAMLGAARFQAGDAIGAASAFRKVLDANPDDARSWARLGESLVRSQDGVIGADAEAAFLEAVKRDPDQLGALYFLGEAAMARKDAPAVRRWWTPLMSALDPADPRRRELQQRLAQVEGPAS